MRLGPTAERLSGELGSEIDFYRINVHAGSPEDWAQVRDLFRVGPRLPLLALFGLGRWQRSLQGPAPEEVVRPFLTGPFGFDANGDVL